MGDEEEIESSADTISYSNATNHL